MKKIFIFFEIIILIFISMPIKEAFASYSSTQTDEMLQWIYEDRAFNDVVSQDRYEGFELEWNYSKYVLYDILVGVNGKGICASYEYDNNMNRITKVVNNTTTKYLYDGDKISVEKSQNYVVKFLYNSDKKLIGFNYNGNVYDYIYEDNVITGIKLGEKIIVEYEYVGCGEINVYDISTNLRIKNESPDFVGNINKMRYNGFYYDEETGWCYVGRFYDFEHDRYIDGLSEVEIATYIEEYGYTVDMVYHINTFMTVREGMEEREDISRNIFARSDYETSLDEQTKTIARTIYGESHTDYRDIKGVARVIEERVRQTKEGISDYGGTTAYQVVTCDGQFLAYMNRNLSAGNPNRSTYWDMNLNDGTPATTLILGCAIRLNSGSELITSPELLDYSGQTFFTSLNSIKEGIDDKKKKIVYTNGCWHLYTYTNGVKTGDKKIKNLVTVFGKVTSQSQLEEYANTYGSQQIYNVFFKYK